MFVLNQSPKHYNDHVHVQGNIRKKLWTPDACLRHSGDKAYLKPPTDEDPCTMHRLAFINDEKMNCLAYKNGWHIMLMHVSITVAFGSTFKAVYVSKTTDFLNILSNSS